MVSRSYVPGVHEHASANAAVLWSLAVLWLPVVSDSSSFVLWRALARVGYRAPNYNTVVPELPSATSTPQQPISILRGSAPARKKVRRRRAARCGTYQWRARSERGKGGKCRVHVRTSIVGGCLSGVPSSSQVDDRLTKRVVGAVGVVTHCDIGG